MARENSSIPLTKRASMVLWGESTFWSQKALVLNSFPTNELGDSGQIIYFPKHNLLSPQLLNEDNSGHLAGLLGWVGVQRSWCTGECGCYCEHSQN